MSGEGGAVLTIGHSNHPIATFLGLLERRRVTALADVRSAPYSRFNPQFNREPLAAALKGRDIRYVYLGRELGGRSDDPACYEDGRIRYDRVARTDRFREGLERVMRGAAEHRIALMCAEKEPLDCHRTLLVARALEECGVDVGHVLADGGLESQAAAMERLLVQSGLSPEGDLLRRQQPRGELIAEAVARRAGRVGHAVDDPADRSPATHAAAHRSTAASEEEDRCRRGRQGAFRA